MSGKQPSKYFMHRFISRKFGEDLKNKPMKQPELGRRITELRKGKGLTQEELVDKCNISVRTLQRIEAGEVTPRSYTVKTILLARYYVLSIISDIVYYFCFFAFWFEVFFLI